MTSNNNACDMALTSNEDQQDTVVNELITEHVSFIKKHSNLFNFKMIKIFQQAIFDDLDLDWKDYWNLLFNSDILEVNFIKSCCPSMKEFAVKCNKYTIEESYKIFNIDIEDNNNNFKLHKNISPKKSHEINKLVSLVNAVGIIVGCKRILDVGSGLGYVDLCLHKYLNYAILGLECDAAKVEAANNLKQKICRPLCSNVEYVTWKLIDDSIISTAKYIKRASNKSLKCPCLESKPPQSIDSAIMISLHSCGNLTPAMIKMFTYQTSLCAAVVMPCCYHKMELSHGKIFPMSAKLQRIMLNNELVLDCCGLRLASEQTLASVGRKSKLEFMQDVQCISFRAILQSVCDREGVSLQKLKRRCSKKNSFQSFEEFISLSLKNYEFAVNGIVLNENELMALKDKLLTEYSIKKSFIPNIALIRILQLHLQPVIETLVLLDKLLYLKENGISNCGLAQIFDKTVSPRNTAIVCFRDYENKSI